jgi:hypothetical protein
MNTDARAQFDKLGATPIFERRRDAHKACGEALG